MPMWFDGMKAEDFARNEREAEEEKKRLIDELRARAKHLLAQADRLEAPFFHPSPPGSE